MRRHPLDEVRIATPCPISWSSMTGDSRVRFCSACRLNVYNVSKMTRQEAVDLIGAAEGRLCLRLYRRRDGTVMTSDCPRRKSWAAILGRAAALLLTAVGLFLGTCTVMFWRDVETLYSCWFRTAPPVEHELTGVVIQPPPLDRPEPRDTQDTGDLSDDTPPFREPPEAR